MAFVKISNNKYRNSSGKVFTEKQVKMYYDRKGTFDKINDKAKEMKKK